MKRALLLAGSILCATALPIAAAEHVIDQKGKKFIPSKITAKVGDTLVFMNSESKRRRHNVYTKSPAFKYVKIKVQRPGESGQITLKNPGSFTVLCSFHPRMKLNVTVTE